MAIYHIKPGRNFKRVVRHALLCRGALTIGLCLATTPQSTLPQDPIAEPHHHLILDNDLVRVFSVTLPEGQETYVRHRYNFLTVTLEDGRVVMWLEGTVPGMVFSVRAGDTRFFLGRAALGTRNEQGGIQEHHR